MLASPSLSSCALSSLPITHRAGHAFAPQAILDGFACHASGVELAAAGPSRVHARVRSRHLHEVVLRADGGRLIIACTCLARSRGAPACKHAWAALLEVDRQNLLSDFSKTRGRLVVEAAPVDPTAPRDVTESGAPANARATTKASRQDERARETKGTAASERQGAPSRGSKGAAARRPSKAPRRASVGPSVKELAKTRAKGARGRDPRRREG